MLPLPCQGLEFNVIITNTQQIRTLGPYVDVDFTTKTL